MLTSAGYHETLDLINRNATIAASRRDTYSKAMRKAFEKFITLFRNSEFDQNYLLPENQKCPLRHAYDTFWKCTSRRTYWWPGTGVVFICSGFHMYTVSSLLCTVFWDILCIIYIRFCYCNLIYLHKGPIDYVAQVEKKTNIQEDSMGNFHRQALSNPLGGLRQLLTNNRAIVDSNTKGDHVEQAGNPMDSTKPFVESLHLLGVRSRIIALLAITRF